MEMSPQQVRNASFKSAKRGFDPDEVQAFLRDVAESLEAAQNQSTAMEARARAAVARLQEVSTAREAPAAPVERRRRRDDQSDAAARPAHRRRDRLGGQDRGRSHRHRRPRGGRHHDRLDTRDVGTPPRGGAHRGPSGVRGRAQGRPERGRGARSRGVTSSSPTSTNSSTSSSINATGCARRRPRCSTSPSACRAGSATCADRSCRHPTIPAPRARARARRARPAPTTAPEREPMPRPSRPTASRRCAEPTHDARRSTTPPTDRRDGRRRRIEFGAERAGRRRAGRSPRRGRPSPTTSRNSASGSAKPAATSRRRQSRR